MRRRTGFTIIELLVAMALIVFIMAILAEAFVEAMKTFRNMKAIGDMNARLRMTQAMLRDDLSADHFEGKRRLSDPFFWTIGPPREGYFRIWHSTPIGSATFYTEGAADGVQSYYATDHWLQYTVKKRGNDRQSFYTATVPTTSPLPLLGTPDSRYQDGGGANAFATYNSQWAEVAWFLRPNGATSGTLPLYTLYRRQRVVVPSTVLTTATGQLDLNYQSINTTTGAIANGGTPLTVKPDYLEVSTSVSSQGTLYFNSPRDLTIPQRRFGMNTSTQLPGLPLRSDGTYRYPAYALGPLSNTLPVQSPNYQPDDEDCTAALTTPPYLPYSKEGTDIILTDVISFAVIPLFNGQPTADFPTQNQFFPQGVSVFDTWSNSADDVYDYTLWDNPDFLNVPAGDPRLATLVPTSPPKPVLTGIQISIRVWDDKTKQARQITVLQDL